MTKKHPSPIPYTRFLLICRTDPSVYRRIMDKTLGENYSLDHLQTVEQATVFCQDHAPGCILIDCSPLDDSILIFINSLNIPTILFIHERDETKALEAVEDLPPTSPAHPVSDYLLKQGLNSHNFRKSIQYALWIARGPREQIEEKLHSAMEAAEKANRAKSEFLAKISHEVRTPLNAILGYAQILAKDPLLINRHIKRINGIYRSGRRLLTLINEFLDLSQIEAGRMELNLTSVHLPNFLRDIVEITRVKAHQRGIGFFYEPLSLPEGVQVDEKKLRQVLLNLLENAIKFTDVGHVSLKVHPIGDLLRFEVVDTGVGISPSDLKKIFSPFFQAVEKKNVAEGVGLGLTISQRFMEKMHSKIQVDSELTKGSAFRFDLNLPEVTLKKNRSYHKINQVIIGYKGRIRTILVADNQTKNRMELRNALVPLGFRIIEAVDGRSCLNNALEHQPDALLLGLRMIMIDGFEATRRIRENKLLSKLPIIGISSGAFEDTHSRSLQAGCSHFLTRSFDLDELLWFLHIYLDLEWIFQENEDFEPPLSDDDLTSQARRLRENFPDEAEKLTKLARLGNVKKIRIRLTQIEREDASLSRLTANLKRWIKGYRFEKMIQLLNDPRE